MHNKSILALATVAAFTTVTQSALAADHEVATYQLDTAVTLLSDQRTRGISDSLMQPALKLSANFAHESGMVAIAEIVTVSQKQFLNGKGLDVTLGGGYRFGNPEGWHFGTGLATEIFPDAKFDAPHNVDWMTGTPLDVRSTGYNTGFAVLEIGYGAIEGRILDVLSKTYRGADTGGVCGALLQFAADPMNPTKAMDCYARGDHNSQGSLLYDLDYKIAVAPATTLTLHVGYQNVANFAEANFTDYRIGLMRKQWGFEWSADYYTTRTKARELYLTQDGTDVRAVNNSKVVLSVSHKF
jgi:hypothetical protein